jgi:hypothetical protein
MTSTDAGIQIDVSVEHSQKASSLRTEIVLPLSKVKSKSCPQNAKQALGIVSIEEGMQIDFSLVQPQNADSSNAQIRAMDSNLTFPTVLRS